MVPAGANGPSALRCYDNKAQGRRHVTRKWGEGRPFQRTWRRNSASLCSCLPLRECLAGTAPRKEKRAGSSSRMAASVGVYGEGNGRLRAAFARTPPKPSCHVCRVLGRQPEFPNLLQKQGWEAGHVSQAKCNPASQRSFTAGSEITPNGERMVTGGRRHVACFWKH